MQNRQEIAFTKDFLDIVKKRRAEFLAGSEAEYDAWECGQYIAYDGILISIIEQARLFDMPFDEIGIGPEEEAIYQEHLESLKRIERWRAESYDAVKKV